MLPLTQYKTLLFDGRLPKTYRYVSKYLNKDRLSKNVRQKFLDYYINDNSHNFVRSSPVVPFCDPTVAFVNAGMNQFKGILLGQQIPIHKKVANSQKCVRVGGKHNDLNIVGTDGYHHTFFEMLGSWSFGAYYKKKACELAWKLLTDIFKINKNMLYVTYFKGNPRLHLEPDLECKEIWKSLGIPEDRILPFGMDDNFWEMGAIGPCGPCTEIHVDMRGPTNRAKFVNKGLHDLQEIWNIVFIEYKRNENGVIEKLPLAHIDTGMGFERLCAILQGKTSNYDTDLFAPIFNVIPKICKDIPSYNSVFGEKDWNNLHTNYRILADHTRMLTVCLSDGMIPEANQKLRRIMRKAFYISDSVFKQEYGLVKELSNFVVEILGGAYPELERNISYVHQILDYEENLYRYLRSSSTSEWKIILESEPNLNELDILEMPGLLGAYKNIRGCNLQEITPEYGYKLYDTFGLDEDSIIKLAIGLQLPIDVDRFKIALETSKQKTNQQNPDSRTNNLLEKLEKLQATPTDDKFKYRYGKIDQNYIFHGIEAKILFIIKDGVLTNDISPNQDCTLIFDRTTLYCESGGQLSDSGYAIYKDGVFEINELENINGIILHKGKFKGTQNLSVGEFLKLNVDEDKRLKHMRNHTATHLLNSVLKKVKGATCQKSSKVSEKCLSFDVGVFGDKISAVDIKNVEKIIGDVIREGVPVKTSEVDSLELLTHDNITMVPGEVYPEAGIRLVEIDGSNITSREPCCGTHVLNTSDIIDFCVTGCKSLGRSTASIQAVTGYRAKIVRENGVQIVDDINTLKKNINNNSDKGVLAGII
ncbi:alanine--tRNA ligase, mitochondrial isoform X2 [Onthophagus taurus]|uniref:alanine--tRNA ligase, mitochondrial isoform X2 n=1 Tax=Onthophagus taurus TaxID=166361 RepID=UPI000C1FE735|nr:alanine--tRNA ligase, mitochondrial isoform X2 [Onthophagus taurus]